MRAADQATAFVGSLELGRPECSIDWCVPVLLCPLSAQSLTAFDLVAQDLRAEDNLYNVFSPLRYNLFMGAEGRTELSKLVHWCGQMARRQYAQARVQIHAAGSARLDDRSNVC